MWSPTSVRAMERNKALRARRRIYWGMDRIRDLTADSNGEATRQAWRHMEAALAELLAVAHQGIDARFAAAPDPKD